MRTQTLFPHLNPVLTKVLNCSLNFCFVKAKRSIQARYKLDTLAQLLERGLIGSLRTRGHMLQPIKLNHPQ